MDKKTIVVSALVSAVVAVTAAAAVWLVFYFYKPGQTPEIPQTKKMSEKMPIPVEVEDLQPKEDEIPESSVSSLSLDTNYRGYFDEGAKCRQTYNEMFGDNDGYANQNSACSVNLTFNSDGSAEKKIIIRRYDRALKASREIESTVWESKISGEQFEKLTKIILNNDAFQNWSDNVSINTRNCKITVKHANGAKSPMSNVDEKTTVFLEMINAFKDLDRRTAWLKDK